MNEILLKKIFSENMTQFQAWGNYVTNTILEALIEQNEREILKIEPKSRVKDISSFIEKALYRGKNYTDPINEITDKVGTRFVVLLANDIKKIENVIQNNSSIWTFSKDRDYEIEKEQNPTIFGYQSVHYVVKNVLPLSYNGVEIEQNISCEIQIRTLLQHAYSEVTHDTIYKPSTKTDPKMIRKIARSMALMETADENFTQVFEEIEKMKNEEQKILTIFRRRYESIFTPNFNEKLNSLILGSFFNDLQAISPDQLNQFLKENNFIEENIKDRAASSLLFSQPIILGIYFLVQTIPYKVKKYWPLTMPELEPFYYELGISLDR
ncbi:GTP pyrophosphokinase [Leptospira bouyouniensis]|uniref:RelA/SpoT n=1 Tax=Leptospira bouyouniensis TaxID=2484911 RepID=A0ABY2LD18_9LEPT|nr:RelA/SpoT domain-containing protein [Leptospira bouyouniensis]TGK54255.1 RelA/SpoT [Leptospira bouyouniensis]